jgi:RNA polymerase sigma-70 factor, ECF subfamily
LPDPTDRQIVAAVLNGDTARFATLVDRYGRLVRAVALGRGVPLADAEDVAQESLLAAYTKLPQLRDTAGFSSWLARIAHRRAGAWLRRLEARTARERNVAQPDTLPPPQQDLEDEIDAAAIVAWALEGLPETLRLPLALHYFADASPADIARDLSLSRGTVDTRLSRARDQVRSRLRQRGLEGHAKELVRSAAPFSAVAGGRLTFAVMDDVGAASKAATAAPGPSLALCAIGAAAVITVCVAGAHVAAVGWADLRVPSLRSVRARSDRGMAVVLLPPLPPEAPLPLVHVAPGRELEGWAAVDPGRDASPPTRAGGSGLWTPVARTTNAYGVRKVMPPTVGEVTLRVRLKTAPAPMSAIVGFTLYGSDSTQAVLWKNETNYWHYNRYTEGDAAVRIGPVEDAWRDVVIVYRTWSGAYDLWLDGESIVKDAVCASGLAGVPVTGVYLSSGRGGDGWPLLFSDMAVTSRDSDALRLELPARDLAPQPPPRRDRMTLHSGELAGQTLDPARPRIRVAPGAPIAGWLHVSILNTHGASAAFHVIETPSWGDASVAFRHVPLDRRQGLTRHTIRIDRRAPYTPGTYRLLLAGAAETEPAYVASGTNWPIGTPVWENGADIAGWSDELVDEAIATGGVMAPWLHEPYEIAESEVAATAVEVVVE